MPYPRQRCVQCSEYIHEWSAHELSYAYMCPTEDIMAPLSGLDLVQINRAHAYEVAIPEGLGMFDTLSLVFRIEDQTLHGDIYLHVPLILLTTACGVSWDTYATLETIDS